MDKLKKSKGLKGLNNYLKRKKSSPLQMRDDSPQQSQELLPSIKSVK